MLTPETFPVILGHEPAHSDDIDDTSNAICLKNAKGVMVIITEYTAGGDTDLVLTVHEGDTAAEAEAGTHVLAATFPIWVCSNSASSDALVRESADAAGYTIDATGAGNFVVVFYIKAAILTAGRPWVHIGTSGGNAANIASIVYVLDGERYQQTTPPTAIA